MNEISFNSKYTQFLVLPLVIGVAFFTHSTIVKKNINKTDRGVANIASTHSQVQLTWEKSIAEQLSKGSLQTQKNMPVSWQDKLVYEFLKGHYNVRLSEGTLAELSLAEAKSPLLINPEDFVKQYGTYFKKYAHYKIQKENNEDRVTLTNQNAQEIGSITLKKNAQGEVTQVIFASF